MQLRLSLSSRRTAHGQGDVMGREKHIVCFGLVLLVQHVAARSYIHTFPPTPAAVVAVAPHTGPQSNLPDKGAPMLLGRDPHPPIFPTQPVAAKPGAHNMRLAARNAAAPAAAAASPAAANIPFAPSIPYNHNSLYRPMLSTNSQQQDGQVGVASSGSGIPESHPVGMLAPSAAVPSPGRQRGMAGILSSGAQAVSALAKMWRKQGASPDTPAEEAVTPQAYSGSSSYISQSGPVPQQQPSQAAVGIASAVTTAPQPMVHFPSGAMPLNSLQQHETAIPAVRAVDKPGHRSSVSTAGGSAAGGVMSEDSRSRRAQPRYSQQGAAAAALSAVPAGYSGPTFGGAAAVQAVQQQQQQPVMQPLAAGLARMATNNMGAPVAGPLGGPTYMPARQPAATAAVSTAAAGGAAPAGSRAQGAGTSSQVSVASVGSFSSAPAAAADSGMGSLAQHFAGGKPPMYAPLPSTMHVAPAKGSSSSTKGIVAGPSIDDVSAAVGAPVAQLTWQLPKKVHVAWAPAADLLRAAPVVPFDMPSSMRGEGEAGSSGQASRGAVSHHVTPTWVPAAI